MKKFAQVTLALAMTFGLTLAANAQTMTQTVTVGDSMTMPALSVRQGEDLMLNVNNPTDQAVLVYFPELALSYWVPAESSQNLYVDISPVQGEELSYVVLDANANRLASGQIINEGSSQIALTEIEQSYIATESSSTYLETAQYQQDEEPEYTPSQGSSAVRGYW